MSGASPALPLNLEGLTPAEAQIMNAAVAQIMAARSAGDASQGDGGSQQPDQGAVEVSNVDMTEEDLEFDIDMGQNEGNETPQ